MRQAALGLFSDVEQRRKEDARDANFLGDVGHILALLVFQVAVGRFPVVGHQEDGVRACQCRGERFD